MVIFALVSDYGFILLSLQLMSA